MPAIVMVRFLLALFVVAAGHSAAAALTAADSTAIRAVENEYVAAWLRDDVAGVLATFDSTATILPPGKLPISGASAIRDHWWPQDGSTTKITAFEWAIEEIGGAEAYAFTRGISTVSWTYDKDETHQEATVRSPNLTLLRKRPDGTWRITHQMWGPPIK
ncbi:MAG: YybH family protein [bacterium]